MLFHESHVNDLGCFIGLIEDIKLSIYVELDIWDKGCLGSW